MYNKRAANPLKDHLGPATGGALIPAKRKPMESHSSKMPWPVHVQIGRRELVMDSPDSDDAEKKTKLIVRSWGWAFFNVDIEGNICNSTGQQPII